MSRDLLEGRCDGCLMSSHMQHIQHWLGWNVSKRKLESFVRLEGIQYTETRLFTAKRGERCRSGENRRSAKSWRFWTTDGPLFIEICAGFDAQVILRRKLSSLLRNEFWSRNNKRPWCEAPRFMRAVKFVPTKLAPPSRCAPESKSFVRGASVIHNVCLMALSRVG